MFDQQWELTYPGVVLTLGSNPALPAYLQRGYHHLTAPTIGEADLEVDDQRKPRGDGMNFGQDFRGGTVITFDLGLRGTSNDDVLALSAALLSAWRGDEVRNTPGDVATLCTSSLGRLRACYGRPRRASTVHTKPKSALMLGTLDFQTVDDLWYDPVPSTVVVPLMAPPSGGATFPATFPLNFVASAVNHGVVQTLGEKDIWPIIKINGPITNPSVSLVNNWTLALNTIIGVGQSVTIDTRPWVATVTGSTGSLAGKLTRASKLEKTFMKPNTKYTVSLRGIDLTGTSNVTFSWHNTYAGI